MSVLVAYLLQTAATAIYTAKTQLSRADAKQTLLDIIRIAVKAYEEHTGQPLDPALIKVENPL